MTLQTSIIRRRRLSVKRWDITSLFASDGQGALLDFTASSMFQDATGRVPVVGTGDPVGLAWDLSKAGDRVSAAGENLYLGEWFTRSGNTLQTIENGATSIRDGVNPALTREVSGLTIGAWYRFTADIGTSEASCFFRVNTTGDLKGTTLLDIPGVQNGERLEVLWQATRASAFMGVVAASNATGDYVSINSGQLQEVPGNHAVQSVNHDHRPTHQSDGQVSWIEHDGIDDGLILNTRFGLPANPALTVIVALRHDNPGLGDVRVWTLGNLTAGGIIAGSVGAEISWRHNNGNRTFPGLSPGQDYVVAWVRDEGATYGQERVFVDGIELEGGGSVNPNNTPSDIGNLFSLSPRYGGNRFKGRMYGNLVAGRALSDEEIFNASKWMAAKQGRTL
ncbi:hypothetical protein [Epibacterium ulvae]|uniref:hypothetical protein n=1 Tax=Epibacterium ulvae TaxID=1156985 RepID=UPI002492CA65|nr:hypothetical protein [Epibacterium ulvae]